MNSFESFCSIKQYIHSDRHNWNPEVLVLLFHCNLAVMNRFSTITVTCIQHDTELNTVFNSM